MLDLMVVPFKAAVHSYNPAVAGENFRIVSKDDVRLLLVVVVMWTRGGSSGLTLSLVQEIEGGAVSPVAEQKRRTTDPLVTALDPSVPPSRSCGTV